MSTQRGKEFLPGDFIEKKLPVGTDLTEAFQKHVLPYLFTAYLQYKSAVLRQGQPDLSNMITNGITVRSIEAWARGTPILAHGIVDEKRQGVDLPDLQATFPSQIERFEVPSDPKNLNRVLGIWFQIMQRGFSWNPNIPNSPYIIDLTDGTKDFYVPVSHIPKVITLGGYRLLRLMDAFYAPDKQGAEWAEKLFDLIADKYEKIVDTKLKEHIDLFLLAYCKGNVLDIGCGTGLMQKWLEKFWEGKPTHLTLFGIDISSKMLEIAAARGEITLKGNVAQLTPEQIKEGFRKINHDVDQFDHAIMSYVDNWTTHEERVGIFGTVQNLLKPGGVLRFNVYNISDPNWLEYYKQILLQMGFKKIKSTENKLPARDGYREVGFVFAYK